METFPLGCQGAVRGGGYCCASHSQTSACRGTRTPFYCLQLGDKGEGQDVCKKKLWREREERVGAKRGLGEGTVDQKRENTEGAERGNTDTSTVEREEKKQSRKHTKP